MEVFRGKVYGFSGWWLTLRLFYPAKGEPLAIDIGLFGRGLQVEFHARRFK